MGAKKQTSVIPKAERSGAESRAEGETPMELWGKPLISAGSGGAELTFALITRSRLLAPLPSASYYPTA